MGVYILILFQIWFSYSNPFDFLSKLKNNSSVSTKYSAGIFIKFALSLWINLWGIHNYILSPLIHEHSMALHLFRSFLIYFFGIL